jgi:poly(hydroxyalkanoate) depolymerase family esterase
MKRPFNARAPAWNAQTIQDTVQRALASAGLDARAGPLRDLTQTLRRALAAGPPGEAAQADGHTTTAFDIDAREIPPAPGGSATGRFDHHRFSSAAGSLAYRLYRPAELPAAPCPMLVMLHGCTQSADDFAAGTQMNRLADAHGFLVVYPEQSQHTHAARCWHWYRPQDQSRDAGEPALLAGIVREVAQRQGADPQRIFVAGLSAGAAMAVVLGETYPELFAGVGVHSGLPYGSASDLPSAMAAMQGRRAGGPRQPGAAGAPGMPAAGARRQAVQAVPTIVFHGDGDHTVQASNGEQIVQQALAAHRRTHEAAPWQAQTEAGVSAGGRRYTRTRHVDRHGQTRIESWALHGAGHAWSGGHPSGSCTDATGPDASAEMVRFFRALPRAGSA